MGSMAEASSQSGAAEVSQAGSQGPHSCKVEHDVPLMFTLHRDPIPWLSKTDYDHMSSNRLGGSKQANARNVSVA